MNVLQHNYLAIQLPDDWEDASQVIALGPEDGGFRPNIIFSNQPAQPNEDAVQFAARQLAELRAALTEYRVVEEGSRKFGPNVGYLREQSFAMDKGEIGQLQFYIVIEGRNYTFTFTHLKDKLESIRPLFERLVAGARLNPPRPLKTGESEFNEF